MKAASAVLVFISLFVPFSYFNHSDGWNQRSRLAELHAIVLQGTLRIDKYHEITGDKALIDGHYYSEKAPATVLAALPAFALTVLAQQASGVDPDSPDAWQVSQWVATAGSVGLIAALGGTAFFLLVLTPLGAPLALVSTLAVFLGTITWPYATAMFAHAGTIGWLSIALWAALDRPSPRRDVIAGLCAGLAVASEYPAIIAATALGLYLTHAAPARAWRYALALAPGALIILGNNFLISGSPFQVGYGSNPAFPGETAGNAFGFSLPDAGAAGALLWGEYRGLFFWSPILLLAVPGLVAWFYKDRGVAVMMLIVLAFMLLQVASFYYWWGGNAVGPRYLAPAIPFLALAAAYGINDLRIPGVLVAVVSIVIMTLVTAIAIDPPEDVLTPLQSFYLERLRTDRFAENLGTALGLSWRASLALPAAVVAMASAGVLLLGQRAGAPAR